MLNLCRASARGLSAAVSLVTLALLSGGVPAARAAGPIPDKGLEAAVRQQVFEKRDKPDELTEDDLKKVFILEGRNKGIKDLTGLEKCPNLALINLAGNEIEKVDALKDLKTLQSLDLSKNTIVDIAPLANVKALQFVELSDNQIASVEPLADMPKLSALYIAGNKLTTAAPLAKLPKLSSLDLARNQLTEVKDLAGVIPNLMTFKITGNKVADLSPFAAAAPRMLLLMENNAITDLAPLVEACKKDAEGEKRFAPFLRLYLAGNPLSDAAKGPQLEALKAAGVRIVLEADKK
jgi:internalin A